MSKVKRERGPGDKRIGSDCQVGPLVTIETQASCSPPHLLLSHLASLGWISAGKHHQAGCVSHAISQDQESHPVTNTKSIYT